jgi:ubiquinone/menaquinone biosynthesis C-methylase UbiE
MSDRFSLEQIRDFWVQQAIEHGLSPAASWSDRMVIDMEIRELLKYLEDGDRVLDIGCANGYSTMQFAIQKRINIRGVDFIPEMIEQAHSRLHMMGDQLAGAVEFDVADITQLDEPTAAYDKVIVIRVVINLGDWNSQVKGLRECARVLKSGGTLLLSEATVQGWNRLNQFRSEWGLTDIPMPPFNEYLDQEKVTEVVADELELVEIVNFASTYYVGTRVLKPLLAQALGSQINVANPDMEWNRWFSQLPAAGDYGTQKLFVFRKK